MLCVCAHRISETLKIVYTEAMPGRIIKDIKGRYFAAGRASAAPLASGCPLSAGCAHCCHLMFTEDSLQLHVLNLLDWVFSNMPKSRATSDHSVCSNMICCSAAQL